MKTESEIREMLASAKSSYKYADGVEEREHYWGMVHALEEVLGE